MAYSPYDKESIKKAEENAKAQKEKEEREFERERDQIISERKVNVDFDGPKPHAPYNFVPFSDAVLEYPEEKLPNMSDMNDELYSGEVCYTVESQTPIFINAGKERNGFFRDAKDRFAIPGSTMRGLIRSNVQILGLCGFGSDIDDYRMMYRHIAAGVEMDLYRHELDVEPMMVNGKQKSVTANVQAGYIACENGRYIIYKTKGDRINAQSGKINYYVVSEDDIIDDYLMSADGGNFKPLTTDNGNLLEHELTEHKPRPKNKDFKPFFAPVKYITEANTVVGIGNERARMPERGYVTISGYMNGKKAVYVIPEIDEDKEKAIYIPDKDVKSFKIDYKRKENQLGTQPDEVKNKMEIRKFYDLPKEGEGIRPVFYIMLGKYFYFGYTPYLRLFFDRSVKECLPDSMKEQKEDYCTAIFGTALKDRSRKGRVSFTNATAEGSPKACDKRHVVLASPKPTDYYEYLEKKNGNPQTYNNKDARLRGVKQYWLHKSIVKDEGGSDKEQINENIASLLMPLPSGSKFRGSVRFNNLRKEELGLLLWAMQLDKNNSWMNVGMAKSYGYGVIKLNIDSLKLMDLNKAYSTSSTLNLNPYIESTDMISDLIKAYKDEADEQLESLGEKKLDKNPVIRDFFAMKDKNKIPDNKVTKYMTLEEFGKQHSTKVNLSLPTVSEIVNKNK